MYPWTFRRWLAAALLSTLVLAACGGAATPQLIGSYPRGQGTGAESSAYAPAPFHRGQLVVYDAYLELRVRNTDAAAEQAARLAYDHGGYLASSRSWYLDGRKHTTLTLAVPAARFDSVRGELLRLGTLIGESVSGDLRGDEGIPWNSFSHITVHLIPAAASPAGPSLGGGWDPGRTFARAFGVFAAIFTFLVDVAIWAAVVVGPFVLMGLGARAAVRRLRNRP